MNLINYKERETFDLIDNERERERERERARERERERCAIKVVFITGLEGKLILN